MLSIGEVQYCAVVPADTYFPVVNCRAVSGAAKPSVHAIVMGGMRIAFDGGAMSDRIERCFAANRVAR